MQVVDQAAQFHHQRVAVGCAFVQQFGQVFLGLRQLLAGAAADGDAPAQRAAQGAQHVDVRGRARHIVAGALVLEFRGGRQLGFHHVRQFQVLEKIIHEFFARQFEDEVVFRRLVAIARLAPPAATAAFRPGDLVAFQVFLVAGIDHFPDAAMRVAERRFAHVLDGDADLFAILDVRDRAPLDGAPHGILDLALVTPQETLAVDGGFILALQAPVDEVCQRVPPCFSSCAPRLLPGGSAPPLSAL